MAAEFQTKFDLVNPKAKFELIKEFSNEGNNNLYKDDDKNNIEDIDAGFSKGDFIIFDLISDGSALKLATTPDGRNAIGFTSYDAKKRFDGHYMLVIDYASLADLKNLRDCLGDGDAAIKAQLDKIISNLNTAKETADAAARKTTEMAEAVWKEEKRLSFGNRLKLQYFEVENPFESTHTRKRNLVGLLTKGTILEIYMNESGEPARVLISSCRGSYKPIGNITKAELANLRELSLDECRAKLKDFFAEKPSAAAAPAFEIVATVPEVTVVAAPADAPIVSPILAHVAVGIKKSDCFGYTANLNKELNSDNNDGIEIRFANGEDFKGILNSFGTNNAVTILNIEKIGTKEQKITLLSELYGRKFTITGQVGDEYFTDFQKLTSDPTLSETNLNVSDVNLEDIQKSGVSISKIYSMLAHKDRFVHCRVINDFDLEYGNPKMTQHFERGEILFISGWDAKNYFFYGKGGFNYPISLDELQKHSMDLSLTEFSNKVIPAISAVKSEQLRTQTAQIDAKRIADEIVAKAKDNAKATATEKADAEAKLAAIEKISNYPVAEVRKKISDDKDFTCEKGALVFSVKGDKFAPENAYKITICNVEDPSKRNTMEVNSDYVDNLRWLGQEEQKAFWQKKLDKFKSLISLTAETAPASVAAPADTVRDKSFAEITFETCYTSLATDKDDVEKMYNIIVINIKDLSLKTILGEAFSLVEFAVINNGTLCAMFCNSPKEYEKILNSLTKLPIAQDQCLNFRILSKDGTGEHDFEGTVIGKRFKNLIGSHTEHNDNEVNGPKAENLYYPPMPDSAAASNP